MSASATQTEREHLFATSASVLRALPGGALLIDLDGNVRQINPRAEHLLGVEAEHVIDQPLAALPGAEQFAAIEIGAGVACEVEGRPLAVQRQILLDEDGKPEGELLLLRDLSEDVEAQRRQYEYLNRALHDVRVPLQAIGGAAEGLMRGWFGPLNDEQLEFATMIKENATHQGRLFSLIYDAYTLSNDIAQMHPEIISIAGVVHEIEHEREKQFAARPLTLSVDLEDGLPNIAADRARLRQLLLALLDNALRYTHPGGSVTLRAARDGDIIQVDVADTGVGIRADEQAKIFTPFFRGDNPLKEGRYGGLSLVIARRIAQLHGGDLVFTSTEGTGTTFSLTIPIAGA